MEIQVNQIRALLDAVGDPTSDDQPTIEIVKRWIAEYIEMRAEEVAHFPGESSVNRWILIFADYGSQFIAAYWREG